MIPTGLSPMCPASLAPTPITLPRRDSLPHMTSGQTHVLVGLLDAWFADHGDLTRDRLALLVDEAKAVA